MQNYDRDDDDLPFMSTKDRLATLGLNMDEVMTPDPYESQPVEKQIRTPKQKPLPGIIKVDITKVARQKGLTHLTGTHAGSPNMTAIMRGTDLAYTTILPLMRHPDQIVMLSLDTLARLCDFLDVQPGDLMSYERGVYRKASLSEHYKRQTG